MTIKITTDELRKLAERFGWGVSTNNRWIMVSKYRYEIESIYKPECFGHFLAAMIEAGYTPDIEWRENGILLGWNEGREYWHSYCDDMNPNEIMPALVRAAIDMFESEGWK